MDASPARIVHIVHRFAIGGAENGLVNLINRLPADLARHHIIALCGIDPAFAARVVASRCTFESLDLRPQRQTALALADLTRRLRRLAPAIVHTRNIATLECQVAAFAAGVPVRIHGEHGWDEHDRYGSRRRYTWLRRLVRPLVHEQIALSGCTARYLREVVGVRATRLRRIDNGVDTERFAPRSAAGPAPTPADYPFSAQDFVLVTVGRLSPIKNQALLLQGFLALRESNRRFAQHARLIVVGDGPERADLQQQVARQNAQQAVWFAGNRHDVAALLRLSDVFVLASRAEGLCNAILEAMASGLAIIATDVGGNAELIEHDHSGTLVANDDAAALTRAMARYFEHRCHRITHGCSARARALQRFSIQRMVSDYGALYRHWLTPGPDSPALRTSP